MRLSKFYTNSIIVESRKLFGITARTPWIKYNYCTRGSCQMRVKIGGRKRPIRGLKKRQRYQTAVRLFMLRASACRQKICDCDCEFSGFLCKCLLLEDQESDYFQTICTPRAVHQVNNTRAPHNTLLWRTCAELARPTRARRSKAFKIVARTRADVSCYRITAVVLLLRSIIFCASTAAQQQTNDHPLSIIVS